MFKKIGITRVRNESHIIWDTLNHVSQFVDGIIVLDDSSQDNTVDIANFHPHVIRVIENKIWEPDPKIRRQLEGIQRQQVYNAALQYDPEWIYYFDADEFADFEGIDFTADAYKMRLWDFYITPEDKDEDYKSRVWIGPEYRDILMLWKVKPGIFFTSRVPKIPSPKKIVTAGSVKHYGKAISVQEWEDTCKYYMHHLNERGIKKKWTNRVGKAIHTLSDFGNPLIHWVKRKELGFPLVDNQI